MERPERWSNKIEVNNRMITVNYTDLDGKWVSAILYDEKGNEICRAGYHTWTNLDDFIFTERGELIREQIETYFEPHK